MIGAQRTPSIAVVVRLAARDLRGGLRGLRIFLACVAIGVAAIVGVGAVSASMLSSFASQGRAMLGGDISFGRSQRPLAPAEREALQSLGAVAEIATMRGMARAGDRIATVEIKAVDANYPLVGDVELAPRVELAAALAEASSSFGAVADEALAERLGLRIGDSFSLGAARFTLRGLLRSEPDRIATGLGFGPRLMISLTALDASGLAGPMSLTRRTARLALSDGARKSDADVQALAGEMLRRFPDSGWEARTRANVSPQLKRNIERFSQFMSLIGVVSLIVGGVGVAGAVAAFIDRKRESIAVLKAIGASGGTVFAIVLAEMLAVAALGALIGAVVGSAIPYLLSWIAGAVTELPFKPAFSASAVATGFLVGMVTTVAFIIAPAGRAHDAPVATLFRLAAIDAPPRLRKRYVIASSAAFVALCGLVYELSNEKTIALAAIISVFAATVILRSVAAALGKAASLGARTERLVSRLAFRNIQRPGAVTTPVVTSLGLGLTLLVAIVSVDGNIRRQLNSGEPGKTPDFFFVDVQSSQADDFRRLLSSSRPQDKLQEVPMLRGRIVRLAGRRAEDVRPEENAAWVLEGDRGVTYSANVPEGSRVVEGKWWPADYNGAPLVSLDRDIAQGLGLAIGDYIEVNVAGRTISAKIANLRTVDWRSFGINFVLVFSPATFAGAPHTELFSLTSNQGQASADGGLIREVAQRFPNVTALSVRDALQQALAMIEKIAVAIRAASGVTLVTAVLVLGGALAAGQRSRLYDAVVLRTLGATRVRLVGVYATEFLILGAATSAFAILAGSSAAWAIVTRLMKLDFHMDFWSMAAVAGLGSLMTVALGLAATWKILGEKPGRLLRDL